MILDFWGGEAVLFRILIIYTAGVALAPPTATHGETVPPSLWEGSPRNLSEAAMVGKYTGSPQVRFAHQPVKHRRTPSGSAMRVEIPP